MSLSPREFWTVLHGMVFGSLFLLAFAGGLDSLSSRLIWVGPAGPLSGKTGVGVIVWLIAWVVFHSRYKGREMDIGKVTRWSWILIILGFLLTFPPAFELIAETIHGK